MKQPSLVIIKPDGLDKRLVGIILDKFLKVGLKIAAIRLVKANRKRAEEHYRHIKGTPFFKITIDYFVGKFHKQKYLLAAVLLGEDAIKKCRQIAGATDPRDANAVSLRGAFGRVTPQGFFENVIHVSSDPKEAEREIKLWFQPEDITIRLFPVKTKIEKSIKKRVWA